MNPLDWRLKSHRPGVDVAGKVETVGRNVTRFKPGDAVFGAAKGAFAEFACASELRLAVKPDSITFAQAASIPIAGLTALQALRDIAKVQPGQHVLINGAAGGVGTFAAQIAKSLGAHVTGVCSSRNVEQLRALGAERVIDYTQSDFITDDQIYDLVIDNAANRSLEAMGRILSPNGGCVLVGAPKTLGSILLRLLEAAARSLFSRRKFTFFIAKITRQDLETLSGLVTTGRVTPALDKCYPFSKTGDAIAYVESGHARAKVVISLAAEQQ